MIKMTAMPTRPTSSVHGLKRKPGIIGIHISWGKGTVPLIEPTPGRFQGPKISQMVSAVATKFNPRPEKISLTPP